ARNRRFTHTTGASKQIRVMQTVMIQRIDQRLQYVLLPYHFAKNARAPFAGQNLITHAVVALIEATLTKSCSPENRAAIITASGGNRHKVVVGYPSHEWREISANCKKERIKREFTGING